MPQGVGEASEDRRLAKPPRAGESDRKRLERRRREAHGGFAPIPNSGNALFLGYPDSANLDKTVDGIFTGSVRYQSIEVQGDRDSKDGDGCRVTGRNKTETTTA